MGVRIYAKQTKAESVVIITYFDVTTIEQATKFVLKAIGHERWNHYTV